jgi:hypothetical protein
MLNLKLHHKTQSKTARVNSPLETKILRRHRLAILNRLKYMVTQFYVKVHLHERPENTDAFSYVRICSPGVKIYFIITIQIKFVNVIFLFSFPSTFFLNPKSFLAAGKRLCKWDLTKG